MARLDLPAFFSLFSPSQDLAIPRQSPHLQPSPVGAVGGLPFPLVFIAPHSPCSSWCPLLSAAQRQSYEPMLVASSVSSLIKILNSSVFDKIWVFSAEPGSLYGNS